MYFRPTIHVLILLCLAPCAAQAYQPHPAETWERGEALRVAGSFDTGAQRIRLQQALSSGDSEMQMALLREVDRQPGWPAPAREKFLHDFVNELRQEPPGSVSADVIGFLETYPPAVMVPHDDHPGAGVPLFNVRAATAGVLNHWARQEAAFTGAALLAENPDALVSTWLGESGPAARQGLLEALSTASPAQVRAVAAASLEALHSRPEVLQLAARAALISRDALALEALVKGPGGPGMHTLLRQASATLGQGDLLQLLNAALESGNTETAALAMSILSPRLAVDTVEPLLTARLEDPQLRAAAALALERMDFEHEREPER